MRPPPGTVAAAEAPDFERLLSRVRRDDPSVGRLQLSGRGLTAEDASRLAAALDGNTHVSAVVMEGNPAVGDAGARALASALGEGRMGARVSELLLSRCGVGADGGRALAAAAATRGARALRSLGLGGNELGSAGVAAFASAVRTPGCALERLNLAHNRAGVEAVQELADALAGGPPDSAAATLVYLNLDGNEVSLAQGADVDAAVARNLGRRTARRASAGGRFEFVGGSRPPPRRLRLAYSVPGASREAAHRLRAAVDSLAGDLEAAGDLVRQLKHKAAAQADAIFELAGAGAGGGGAGSTDARHSDEEEDEEEDGDEGAGANAGDGSKRSVQRALEPGLRAATPAKQAQMDRLRGELGRARLVIRREQQERLCFRELVVVCRDPAALQYYAALVEGFADSFGALRRLAAGLVQDRARREDYDALADIEAGIAYVTRTAGAPLVRDTLGVAARESLGGRHAEQLGAVAAAAAYLETPEDDWTAAETLGRQLALAQWSSVREMWREHEAVPHAAAAPAGAAALPAGGSTPVCEPIRALALGHVRRMLAALLSGSVTAPAAGAAANRDLEMEHKTRELARAVMGAGWRYQSVVLQRMRAAARARAGKERRRASAHARRARGSRGRRGGGPGRRGRRRGGQGGGDGGDEGWSEEEEEKEEGDEEGDEDEDGSARAWDLPPAATTSSGRGKRGPSHAAQAASSDRPAGGGCCTIQ